MSKTGNVYTFGQNKYSKLGLHFSKSDEKRPYADPIKISMYDMKSPESFVKENAHIVQVCAGYNHSIALSKQNRGYTWGYSGKGVLGRIANPKPLPGMPLPLGFVSGSQATIPLKPFDRFIENNLLDKGEAAVGK